MTATRLGITISKSASPITISQSASAITISQLPAPFKLYPAYIHGIAYHMAEIPAVAPSKRPPISMAPIH